LAHVRQIAVNPERIDSHAALEHQGQVPEASEVSNAEEVGNFQMSGVVQLVMYVRASVDGVDPSTCCQPTPFAPGHRDWSEDQIKRHISRAQV
jgi:hypothetical protein